MNKDTIIKLIADYFKTQPVLKAYLFGSFSMYEDLKDLLGRKVDLVTERSLAPFARESVNRDKILIYERASLLLL